MKMNFAMMQHHNYSLHDLEHMIPWEREVYVTLLSQWIEQENERVKKENARRKSKSIRNQ